MFVGTFERPLDAKGRVVLPATFRDRIELGGYLTKRVDGCLAIMTPDEFESAAAEIVEAAKSGTATDRQTARSFAAGASPVKPDKQGRIAIPTTLRDFAGLQRDCVVIGAINMIEIWDAARWDAANQVGEQNLVEPQTA